MVATMKQKMEVPIRIKIICVVTICFGVALPLFVFGLLPEKPVRGATEAMCKTYGELFVVFSSLFLIVMGVITFVGLIVPYYATEKGSVERARNVAVTSVCVAPAFVALTVPVFRLQVTTAWRVLWSVMLPYFIIDFLDAVKKLWTDCRKPGSDQGK
jgi:hypothetical protein